MKDTKLLLLITLISFICFTSCKKNAEKCWQYSCKNSSGQTEIIEYQWLTEEEANVHKENLQNTLNKNVSVLETGHKTLEDCSSADIDIQKGQHKCYKFSYTINSTSINNYEWITETEAENKKKLLEENLNVEVNYTLIAEHTTVKDCINAGIKNEENKNEEEDLEQRCHKFIYNNGEEMVEDYEWMNDKEANAKVETLENKFGKPVLNIVAIQHKTKEDCDNANIKENEPDAEKCWKVTYNVEVLGVKSTVTTYEWMTQNQIEAKKGELEKTGYADIKVVATSHKTIKECADANVNKQ